MDGSAPVSGYRPAEVAVMLRCSEWWVKEQARRRRIPYSWIGGSYLFTDEHVTEIVRIFEVRPGDMLATSTSRQPVRRTVYEEGEQVMLLTAGRPRLLS